MTDDIDSHLKLLQQNYTSAIATFFKTHAEDIRCTWNKLHDKLAPIDDRSVRDIKQLFYSDFPGYFTFSNQFHGLDSRFRQKLQDELNHIGQLEDEKIKQQGSLESQIQTLTADNRSKDIKIERLVKKAKQDKKTLTTTLRSFEKLSGQVGQMSVTNDEEKKQTEDNAITKFKQTNFVVSADTNSKDFQLLVTLGIPFMLNHFNYTCQKIKSFQQQIDPINPSPKLVLQIFDQVKSNQDQLTKKLKHKSKNKFRIWVESMQKCVNAEQRVWKDIIQCWDKGKEEFKDDAYLFSFIKDWVDIAKYETLTIDLGCAYISSNTNPYALLVHLFHDDLLPIHLTSLLQAIQFKTIVRIDDYEHAYTQHVLMPEQRQPWLLFEILKQKESLDFGIPIQQRETAKENDYLQPTQWSESMPEYTFFIIHNSIVHAKSQQTLVRLQELLLSIDNSTNHTQQRCNIAWKQSIQNLEAGQESDFVNIYQTFIEQCKTDTSTALDEKQLYDLKYAPELVKEELCLVKYIEFENNLGQKVAITLDDKNAVNGAFHNKKYVSTLASSKQNDGNTGVLQAPSGIGPDVGARRMVFPDKETPKDPKRNSTLGRSSSPNKNINNKNVNTISSSSQPSTYNPAKPISSDHKSKTGPVDGPTMNPARVDIMASTGILVNPFLPRTQFSNPGSVKPALLSIPGGSKPNHVSVDSTVQIQIAPKKQDLSDGTPPKEEPKTPISNENSNNIRFSVSDSFNFLDMFPSAKH